MTHIGYVCFFNEETHNGIISDSHRKIHAFVSDKKYDRYQFVTYEGEGACVDEVISLTEYEITDYNSSKSLLAIQKVSDGIFLYDKNRIEYKASGSEYFILNRYCLGQSLAPIKDFNNCKYSISEVHDRVDYVSRNRKKIADSYKVFIKSTHISKTGGDDRFYVRRIVDLCYRDLYVDRFFLSNDVELDRQSGYTSNFDSQYKDGEDWEEERRGRKYFLTNYNYEEHFSYLSKEYSKDEKVEHYDIIQENLLFLQYWGIELYGLSEIPYLDISFSDVAKPILDGNNKLTDFGVTIFNRYEKSKNGLKIKCNWGALQDEYLRELLGEEEFKKLDKQS